MSHRQGRLPITAALIVALLGLAVWILWPEPTKGDSEASDAVASDAIATSAGVAFSRSQPDTPTFTVEGRVVDPEGQPIADARLCAAQPALASVARTCAQTDGAGRARVVLPRSGPVALSADRTGYITLPGPGGHTYQLRTLSPDHPTIEILLVLTPGGRQLHGVVEDQTGGPVEGAWVSLARDRVPQFGDTVGRPLAITDAEGRFALWADTFMGTAIVADADGYAEATTYVSPSSSSKPFVLLLAPEAVLEGHVVDRAGHPVADAWVHAHTPTGPQRPYEVAGAYSQSDGSFRIGKLGPGRYDPYVAGETVGYSPNVVTLWPGDVATNIRIEVDAGLRIAGRVVTQEGPCSEGIVTLVDSLGDARPTQTDSDGAVIIGGLTAGTYETVAQCSSDPTNTVALQIAAGEQDVTWQIPARTGVVVSGVVLGFDGRPAPGATVWLQSDTARDRGTDTNTRGEFQFAGVPPGPFTLSTRGRPGQGDTGSLSIEVAEADLTGLRIELTPTGELEVRVSDRGEPVPAAGLFVAWGLAGQTADTGPDGTALFPAIPAGEVLVYLRPPGVRGRDTESVEPVPTSISVGKRTTVDISAPGRRGQITGIVTTDGDQPALDVRVEVFRERSTTTEEAKSKRLRVGEAFVDLGGRFDIQGLPEGEPLWVTATSPAGARIEQPGVRPGADLTLRLSATVSISGNVATEAGEAVGNYVVSVIHAQTGQATRRRFSNRDGSWMIDGLLPGPYTVTAQALIGTGSRSVDAPTDVDGILLPIQAWGAIRGQVLNTEGRPFVGATVLFESASDGPRSISQALTDAAGRFDLEKLPPGPARLRVTPPDGIEAAASPQNVVVPAGATLEVGL